MILLLACLSLLISPGELGNLYNGHTASVTTIFGLGALPFGFAAGPRYRHQTYFDPFYVIRFVINILFILERFVPVKVLQNSSQTISCIYDYVNFDFHLSR